MADSPGGPFDLVLVGSSFASSFFLREYLKHASPKARVLVLERGEMRTHAWQLQNRKAFKDSAHSGFINKHPTKTWFSTVAFGGNSNCWWGCTPRFLPEDFRLRSTYGVGTDWPLSYDELEPYYGEVEEVMRIAGPRDGSPYPRTRPYPLPPHRLNTPEQRLRKAFPGQFFPMPSARPSIPAGPRPRCCANSICRLCPIDSKFTVLNEMMHLYEDPRVKLEIGASVTRLETAAGLVSGVTYEKVGQEFTARGEVVALGANAMYNPFLLMRSGLTHPVLGKGLHEQVAIGIDVLLDDLNGLDGSTSLTGHGYMLYAGERRRDRAAVLLETGNKPELRDERGKWRQILQMKAIIEDVPSPANYVAPAADRPTVPEMVYTNHSAYAQRALDSLRKDLEPVLAALPVEDVKIAPKVSPGEAHILGTTAMGTDPATSIVDRHLIHHSVRNLVVLGSGAFPTSSPANPTLTLSALSLWSARHLYAPAVVTP